MGYPFGISIPLRFNYNRLNHLYDDYVARISIPLRFNYNPLGAGGLTSVERISIPLRFNYNVGEDNLKRHRMDFNSTKVQL